jgi:hypothetical protein
MRFLDDDGQPNGVCIEGDDSWCAFDEEVDES